MHRNATGPGSLRDTCRTGLRSGVALTAAFALAATLPSGAAAAVTVYETPTTAATTQPTPYYPDDSKAGPGEIQTTERVDIATSQDGYYRQYRIPAMVVTKSGTIITSYDGRKTVADIPSNIDNLVRISHDGGKTWDDQIVNRAGAYPDGYGDPSLGYNPDTGRIFLFYAGSVRQGFFGGKAGTDPDDPNVVQNLVSYSDDDGKTWTHENITPGTKDASWMGTFASSGRATYINTGPYKGRLVQQYVIRDAANKVAVASAYTDDNGKTWHHGQPTAVGFGNENKVEVTSGGDLLLNLRAPGHRMRAISTDGGETWGPVTSDPQLVDPGDNGAVIRAFPKAPESDPRSKWMLSTNNDDPQIRMNTTIRLSCDDGQTWPVSKVLEAGASAYSTLDMMDDQTVGALYERRGYKNITFASFPLAELTDTGLCAPLSVSGTPTLPTGATTEVPVTVTNQTTADLPAGEVVIDGGVHVAGKADAPALAPGEKATVRVPVVVSADSAAQRLPLKASYTADGKTSTLDAAATTVVGGQQGPESVVYENIETQTFDGTRLVDLTDQLLSKVDGQSGGEISVTFNTTASGAKLPQVLFAASKNGVDDHELLLTVNPGGRPYFEIRAKRPNYVANMSPASTLNVADGKDHVMTLRAADGKTVFSIDGTEIYSKAGQYFFNGVPDIENVSVGGVRFQTSSNTAPTAQWFLTGAIKNVKVTTIPSVVHEVTPAPDVKIEPVLDVYRYTSPPGLGAGDGGSYKVRLTNTGNVPLSSLAVSSNIEGVDACFSGTLAPGANVLCTKAHTFTTADVDARSFTPSVTVKADAAGAAFEKTAKGADVPLPEPFQLPDAPEAVAPPFGGCAVDAERPVSATASSEESFAHDGLEDSPASAAIDGDPKTFWSTGWSVGTTDFPNSITLDLGAEKTLCGLNYLPRQGNTNGNIGDYRIYVSNDPDSFGTPVVGGTFVTGDAQQTAYFPKNAVGRYVRLVSYSDIGRAHTETTTAAELSVNVVDPDYVAPDGDPALIPEPVSVSSGHGPDFQLTGATRILTDEHTTDLGTYLSDLLKPATGFDLKVVKSGSRSNVIVLDVDPKAAQKNEQGYTLTVKKTRITITGRTAEGVFNGIQTLRQLLPEKSHATTPQSGKWTVDPVSISDAPRYDYRGGMLDVARRFYPVDDVKQFIDYLAEYKFNVLHLHLTEDQGWRIAIDEYPELTGVGASVQSGISAGTVDNGVAGPWFYSKEDYKQIVDYAAARFIDVVPEIDGPGHSAAAMSAIADLNCDDKTMAPWTNFGRGPHFCMDDAHAGNVAEFLTNVMADVAGQNTGDYIHVGGDEVAGLTDAQYTRYTEDANAAVTAAGKKVMAWNSWMEGEGLPDGGVIQNYAETGGDALAKDARAALDAGHQLLMSPADRTYLDIKYDSSIPFGLTWTEGGAIDLERAYRWDPTTAVPDDKGGHVAVSDDQILGVEFALWADATNQHGTTTPWSDDKPFAPVSDFMQKMLFPRLPAIAEIAWSPQADRAGDRDLFADFQARLVNQAEGWDAAGIDYYRAPDVRWNEKD